MNPGNVNANSEALPTPHQPPPMSLPISPPPPPPQVTPVIQEECVEVQPAGMSTAAGRTNLDAPSPPPLVGSATPAPKSGTKKGKNKRSSGSFKRPTEDDDADKFRAFARDGKRGRCHGRLNRSGR